MHYVHNTWASKLAYIRERREYLRIFKLLSHIEVTASGRTSFPNRHEAGGGLGEDLWIALKGIEPRATMPPIYDRYEDVRSAQKEYYGNWNINQDGWVCVAARRIAYAVLKAIEYHGWAEFVRVQERVVRTTRVNKDPDVDPQIKSWDAGRCFTKGYVFLPQIGTIRLAD